MKRFSMFFKLILIVFCLFLNISKARADGEKRIAVLPFQNLTQDADKNWIGAGFSETLTTKLWNVKSISMVERQQLTKILDELKFQMAGYVDEKTAVEVGKMYGVDVMVLGSYQLMENTLRISARFVDVETGKIIKTAEATGKLSNIYKLQDEIAFKLISSLAIVPTPNEKKQIKANPTENLSAYEWFNKGNNAFTLELFDKAIEYYTKAIKLDKNFAEAYYNRGVVYVRKHLMDKAIENYTKALELNSTDSNAFRDRGWAYWTKGLEATLSDEELEQSLYDEAIMDYSQAIKLNPKDPSAYLYRGFAYESKSLHDAAIKDYTKAINLNPKDAQAYLSRGSAYKLKALYDQAIEDFNKVFNFNPNDCDAFSYRGDAYYSKGLYDKAIADYTRIINMKEKDILAYALEKYGYESNVFVFVILGGAYRGRGEAYYKKGVYDDAISDFKKAVDLIGSGFASDSLKLYFNIDYRKMPDVK